MTREEAIWCIKHELLIYVNRKDLTGQAVGEALDMAIEALSADRPMGEWIFNPKDAIELMFTKPKCSECGFESSDGGNYCPNCGARMKGESHDKGRGNREIQRNYKCYEHQHRTIKVLPIKSGVRRVVRHGNRGTICRKFKSRNSKLK